MKVFAIGDLHLSGQPPTKPMTIFGPHWDNHWERIQAHWREHIEPDDLVFLVGDMSWAMRLSDAKVDLDTIATLPGKKFMIRGNHDYWWTTLKKMNKFIADNSLKNIEFLYNNAIECENYVIVGTRGWTFLENEENNKNSN